MLRAWFCVVALLATILSVAAATPHRDTSSSEAQNFEMVIGRFFEGWNAHDANKMVSAYAADIDHIDVFG